MRKSIIAIVILVAIGFGSTKIDAQTISSSSNLIAQPIADRTVYYNMSDTGVSKPIIWGLDLAWLSEDNIKRGISFMGKDQVDIIRSSFVPKNELLGDTALQGDALTNTNLRLNIINKYLGANTNVVLNCDHGDINGGDVNPYFIGNAANWEKLIDITTTMHEEMGFKVISISPFNEPDYGWNQYSGDGKADFYNICGELRNNSHFDSIRICGGNTLNCDVGLDWYNYLKSRLDEGNTHQLAGSFANYAGFFSTVKANGHHATADELHNVMEAMVGVEYGMQTGIWWGTAEYARSEFVKASDGRRLGYAEHRNNWTAASVYRSPQGKVQAFGGTSERQAVTTSYRFVSKDRDVFYDGHGPQREYIVELPGGTGYQQGQTNAECVVNISYGDDIQPVIKGNYILVNRNSGKVMEIANGSSSNGANLQQGTSSGDMYQKWKVTPVDSRIQGDFSYFTISSLSNLKVPDVLNWSLDDGGNIIMYDNAKGANQQWYLEYVEDGWFYIRSRLSAKCMEVANASTADGANIQQWGIDNGTNQQWRLIPIDAPVEFEAPSAPANLVATPNSVSVRLDWTASPESDVAGYNIYRSESAGGPYSTIARNIKSTSFIDNTGQMEAHYFYAIKAVDNSLNRSAYSNEVSALATGAKDMVAHYKFEENTLDSSIHLNHSSSSERAIYVEGKVDTSAISLNGTDRFLQLPYTIANHQEISILTWVYWNGGASWQRIFDFGNDDTQYMYLTPRLRFAIKDGSQEQRLDASAIPVGEWTHLAVTLSNSIARMYVNGELVDESDAITISPKDFNPVFNYIGRGQLPVPLFDGAIDNFMIFNYALDSSEVKLIHTTGSLYTPPSDIKVFNADENLTIWPVPAKDVIHVRYTSENNNSFSELDLYNTDGRVLMSKNIIGSCDTELNVSSLHTGIYMLKLTSGEATIIKKLIIKH